MQLANNLTSDIELPLALLSNKITLSGGYTDRTSIFKIVAVSDTKQGCLHNFTIAVISGFPLLSEDSILPAASKSIKVDVVSCKR
jgi:hypothetical protein